MTEILVALIVGLTALAAGWLLGRQKGSVAEQRAAGAEARLSEVQARVAATEGELQRTRESLVVVERERTEARTRLEESEKNLAEQKAILEEARTKLVEAFGALAGEALNKNNENFIALAEAKFKELQQTGASDLEARSKAVESLVKPLQEALTRYEKEIHSIENTRVNAYAELRTQVLHLSERGEKIASETGKLVNALRAPQVRGRWGEMTLRRLAELSGMVERCDFAEQETISAEERKLRPDMTIKLPGNRVMLVDSKVALDGYLDAVASAAEDERERHFQRHAAQIRTHMESLSQKRYPSFVPGAFEFVVMFIPGEPFLGAAVERDTTLIEDGLENGVIIATPNNLIGLLLTVARAWREEKLAESAQQVWEQAKEVYERFGGLWEHLEKLRDRIEGTVKTWNDTVGSLEKRVVPSVRRLKDLGAPVKEDIAPLAQVETPLRALPPEPETRERPEVIKRIAAEASGG